MSLPTLPKVQKLQEALHVKAKRSSDFRFYTLYDKMYRADVLWVAHGTRGFSVVRLGVRALSDYHRSDCSGSVTIEVREHAEEVYARQ